MKLFRRIAALALAVAVVAMFGISASAASFSEPINGDFGAFTQLECSITTSVARGVAYFIDPEGNLEFENHTIEFEVTYYDSNINAIRSYSESRTMENTAMSVEYLAGNGQSLQIATFDYSANYFANGNVPCHHFSGPRTLHS